MNAQGRSIWERLGFSTITGVIIGMNIVVFVLTRVWASLQLAATFYVPYSLSEPWRFLTSAFLHAGIMHLTFNMITLYFVGYSLERILGAWRYVAAYLLSAIAGNVAMVATAALTNDPQIAALGASGAVFGLFGVWLAINWRDLHNTQSMLIFLGINLAWGIFAANVAWQAHVGGFIAGAVLGFTWMFSGRHARSRTLETLIDAASVVIIACILGVLTFLGMLCLGCNQ